MTRRLFLWVVPLVVAWGCATAPPPPSAPPPTYEQRLGWILRLEDARVLRETSPAPPMPVIPRGRAQVVPPTPAAPDLTVFLREPDARLRRRAALAIGRVGLADGVEPLLAAVGDEDADVRQMACFALGLLRDPRARAGLIAALEDPDPRVQGRAAEALGQLGDTAAASAIGTMVARHAVDPVVQGLAADDLGWPLAPPAEAVRLGLFALARLKTWEPLASAVLDASGLPKLPWWPVAYALQRVGDGRAVPALLAFVRAGGVEALGFAVRGLGELKEPRALEVLVPLLDPASRDRRIVATAARALAQLGRPEAIEPLRRAATGPGIDDTTRVAVIEALGALGALGARRAVDDLIDLAGHPTVAVRGAALTALAVAEPDTFLTVLSGLDADLAWQGRADLARALGTLDRERALPRLTTLVRDQDQRVVAAALRALATVKAPDLAPLLREHLSKDDINVRATAAGLLGESRPPGGDVWLAEAWRRGKADGSYVARAAALGALTRYGQAAARQAIEEALADPDWAVRVRAMQLAGDLGMQIDIGGARPAPTRLGPGDYEAPALVAPTYSPQVYLDTKKGTIQIELNVLDAPLTSANFVALARKGFFDGLLMHRVVPNFVVQGGDPRGDGEGGPGYTIRDEVNDRPFLRGTVGMALDWADTGGSQFFITRGPQPHLDGRYTAFGTVVGGMEIVDRLDRWDAIDRVRVWDGVSPPTP